MESRVRFLLVVLLVSSAGYLFLKGPKSTPGEEGGNKELLLEEVYENITDILAEPASYEGEVIAIRAKVFRVRRVENFSYLWLDDGTGTIPAEYEGRVQVKEGESGIVRGWLMRNYTLAGGHYLPVVIKVLELEMSPERVALFNISDIREHKAFLPNHPLSIRGKIVDIKAGRGVTFMELDDGTGRVWALIPAAEFQVGDVRWVTGRLALDFRTSSMNESFDVIIVTDDGARILALHEEEAREVVTPIVPLAEGGVRIAEVLNSSATLENQSVKLRAVLKGVMPIKSFYFLTLDDGTGELKARYWNETEIKTGEEVVVTGNVSTKVELGAGYFYEVLLEVESIEKS